MVTPLRFYCVGESHTSFLVSVGFNLSLVEEAGQLEVLVSGKCSQSARRETWLKRQNKHFDREGERDGSNRLKEVKDRKVSAWSSQSWTLRKTAEFHR